MLSNISMRCLIGILALLTTLAQAQPDTLKTSYTTEDSKFSAADMKRFIRYITRADVEEKTLIKLGFWPSTGMVQGRPSLGISSSFEATVEQKFTPAFSGFAGINYAVSYAAYDRVYVKNQPIDLQFLTDQILTNTVAAKIGMRYYYSSVKRIKKGESANNFSGNYLALQVSQTLSQRERLRYYDVVTGDSRIGRNTGVEDRPSIALQWGFQRRIGQLGYIDLNAGPAYMLPHNQELLPYSGFRQIPTGRGLSLQVNAFIGLGW